MDDLVHYPDSLPGITRHRAGRGFSYRAPDGTRIDAAAERRRLAALAVPPAYEDVWICPRPDGHLQATGRDARSRKQYRYHADWTAWRARTKFDHLAAFGGALPSIRRRIARDLGAYPGTRAAALATVLAMIDRLSLRIGNPDYTDENGSHGATTLRNRHLTRRRDGLRLVFTAKGGARVDAAVADRRLARVLHDFAEMPGAALVGWTDDANCRRDVTAAQVNGMLAELTGIDGLTAKTFRTWNGSVAALSVALSASRPTIRAMSEAAAAVLSNTPTVARTSYIHPRVIALAGADGAARRAIATAASARRGLRAHERALLALLAD